MKHIIYIFILMVLLTACGPVLPASPAARPIDPSLISPGVPMGNDQYAPQPGDSTLTRGGVFLESTNMLIKESYPVQVAVNLSGNLPTPCNILRAAVSLPDADKNIRIELYSVLDPEAMCAEVLQPFEVTLSLGSFPTGHYTVLVNDKELGKFDT
jgi:hypothetical protein